MNKTFVLLILTWSFSSAFASTDPCLNAAEQAVKAAEMKIKKQDRNYTFDVGAATVTSAPKYGKMGIYEVPYSFTEECSSGYIVGATPSADGQSCKVNFVRAADLDGACG